MPAAAVATMPPWRLHWKGSWRAPQPAARGAAVMTRLERVPLRPSGARWQHSVLHPDLPGRAPWLGSCPDAAMLALRASSAVGDAPGAVRVASQGGVPPVRASPDDALADGLAGSTPGTERTGRGVMGRAFALLAAMRAAPGAHQGDPLPGVCSSADPPHRSVRTRRRLVAGGQQHAASRGRASRGRAAVCGQR